MQRRGEKENREKGLTPAVFAAIAAAILMLAVPWLFPQDVKMEAVTESAIGQEDAITGTKNIRYGGTCLPGTEYRITVTFYVVDRKGQGLLSGPVPFDEGRQANLRCCPLVMEKDIKAAKRHISIRLSLTTVPKDIKAKGNIPFDPDTQMLRPVVTVEPKQQEE